MSAEPDGVVEARLAGQWLTQARGGTPEDVVCQLLAVQAQDLRGARLAIRARSAGLDSADVDAALADRRLVVTWLNRGTLHLVSAADYWWLHALTTPQLATRSRRRLAQEGVSAEQADRGVAVVLDAIGQHGPLTRAQLRRHLDAAGMPTAGQALVHLLFAASLRGLVVRGPAVGAGEQAFVLVRDWLGEPPQALAADDALGLLASRYLRGHPTASPDDLAAWAGITLGAARRAMGASGNGGDVGGAVAHAATGTSRLPPRLLGPFDPVLHGWSDRRWLAGPYAHVVTANGMFRAVALAGGRVVGRWAMPGGRITLTPFEAIPATAMDRLAAEARDIYRFLGLAGHDLAVAIGQDPSMTS